MRRISHTGVLCWLALACLPAIATAQEDAGVRPEDAAALDRLLMDRNRETMRLGEHPLVVVGIEQGDNDFRASTPALARNVGEAVPIDTEDAYRRRMAMYTDGASYATPPEVHPSARSDDGRGDRSGDRSGAAPELAAAAAEAPTGTEPQHWSWILPLAGFFLLVGFVMHRSGYLFSERD